ncbi:hypothetical protein [Bifidobacterium rousetti]|nr:hypothetical protein [Bifidobacterium rousetti]
MNLYIYVLIYMLSLSVPHINEGWKTVICISIMVYVMLCDRLDSKK